MNERMNERKKRKLLFLASGSSRVVEVVDGSAVAVAVAAAAPASAGHGHNLN
jgi:hypothetical protein